MEDKPWWADSAAEAKVIIRVRMESIDGARRRRLFNNVESARAWAMKWLGEYFDISYTFGYAISGDGINKITCEGVDIFTLLGREREA